MLTTRSVIKTLERLKFSDLIQLAQENGLQVHSKMTKKAIIQALLRPRSLSLKLYGGARTESSSVSESPDPSLLPPVPPVPPIQPPVKWDKIPEPALQSIIKRLSRNDFNRLRLTSRTFNNRIKQLETKDFYKALIAKLPYIYVPIELVAQLYVNSVAWSPDGTRLASGGEDGIIRIWRIDPETGTFQQNPLELRGHTSWVYSLAWSPDGTRLAYCGIDRIIRIWGFDPETGTFQQNPLELRGPTFSGVNNLAWSPDGTRLASSGEDRIIRIWGFDHETGTFQQNPLELRSHKYSTNMHYPMYRVAWSPDGTRIASGGIDRIIRIWGFDPENGTFQQVPLELRDRSGSQVYSLAWSPDGSRLASGGADGIIRIWGYDPNTGTFQQNPLELRSHRNWVKSLAWSPDGTRLASGGADRIIRIWGFDPNTGTFQQNPLELRGHTSWVNSVAWSPDGSRLASGGRDGIIRIWMS